jgi:hypothetical protein
MTAKYRQAAALQRLKDAGGNRLAFNLTAEALADIAAVRECLSLPTATEAVLFALRAAASTHAPLAAQVQAARAAAPLLANAEIDLLQRQRDDLARFVARMARRIGVDHPGHELVNDARDYLREHRLMPIARSANESTTGVAAA